MPTITSHWNIVALDTIPSQNELTKIISTIHCEKLATSDDGFNARWYGTVSVALPNPDSFIPYEEITEEMIIEWVKVSASTDGVDEKLTAEIELQRNPLIVNLPLPWISGSTI